jgi:hypothetical protein
MGSGNAPLFFVIKEDNSMNDIIQEMGIKDLEHVVLKAKDHMMLGGRSFEPGEPVLYFRNI